MRFALALVSAALALATPARGATRPGRGPQTEARLSALVSRAFQQVSRHPSADLLTPNGVRTYRAAMHEVRRAEAHLGERVPPRAEILRLVRQARRILAHGPPPEAAPTPPRALARLRAAAGDRLRILKRRVLAALPADPRDALLARANGLVSRARRARERVDHETFSAMITRVTAAEELLFKHLQRARLVEAERLLAEAERLLDERIGVEER